MWTVLGWWIIRVLIFIYLFSFFSLKLYSRFRGRISRVWGLRKFKRFWLVRMVVSRFIIWRSWMSMGVWIWKKNFLNFCFLEKFRKFSRFWRKFIVSLLSFRPLCSWNRTWISYINYRNWIWRIYNRGEIFWRFLRIMGLKIAKIFSIYRNYQ